MIKLHIGEEVHELTDGEYILGRSQVCDIQVQHETVSRRHARITVRDRQAWIEDLQSSNGTYVNGRAIRERTPLADGDRVHLGKYEIVIEIPVPTTEAPTILMTPEESTEPVYSDQPTEVFTPGADHAPAATTPQAAPQAPTAPQPPPAPPPPPEMPPAPSARPVSTSRPIAEPITGIRRASAAELASVGDRVMAFLIDIVLAFVLLILGWLPFGIISLVTGGGSWHMIGLALGILLELGFVFYNDVYLVATQGASFGKRWMRIRVTTVQGTSPVGWGPAVLRTLGRLLSGSCMMLGYLWALFDAQRQTWHDKIAGTIVVKRTDRR